MTLKSLCCYISPCPNWKYDNYDKSIISSEPNRCCLISIFFCLGRLFCWQKKESRSPNKK